MQTSYSTFKLKKPQAKTHLWIELSNYSMTIDIGHTNCCSPFSIYFILAVHIWIKRLWNFCERKQVREEKTLEISNSCSITFFCFCLTLAPDPPSNLSVSVRSGKSAVISLSPPPKGNYSSFKLRVSAFSDEKWHNCINLIVIHVLRCTKSGSRHTLGETTQNLHIQLNFNFTSIIKFIQFFFFFHTRADTWFIR